MHDDDDNDNMIYFDNFQNDSYNVNKSGNESNIIKMNVDNDKNISDNINKNTKQSSQILQKFSSSSLTKKKSEKDMNIETREESQKEDDFYDIYKDDGEIEDLYEDFDFSSVEVSSSVRTYQRENEIEEENFENVAQHKIMSLTEVTKEKTQK